MHDIRIDHSKNRLYLTLGFIEKKSEMDAIIAGITEVVEQLQTGFTCLSDLRTYRVRTRQDEEFMREIQEILWEAGIDKVVRISESPQFCDHFHFEKNSIVWPGYPVAIVASIEEGEAVLNGEIATAIKASA